MQLFAVYTRLTSDTRHLVKVKGRKKIVRANTNQKRANVAIIISDKIKDKINFQKWLEEIKDN